MIIVKKNENEDVSLYPFKTSEEGNSPVIYELKDEANKSWMTLQLVNNSFKVECKDATITESEEDLQAKLDDLVLAVIEIEQSGAALTDFFSQQFTNPFNPESIKVNTKAFSVKLISDMIDDGYINLSPDFQRNFVWNPIQKSRLIESILLRIPLPMFYFSEDEEGLIMVVDGLQRLTTIKEFMDNKFPLRDLEYLSKTCNGRYYSALNKDGTPNGKKGIDPKYFRWFNMTQFTVNVIDPSSPARVKYDIFKRINTGGKPLNSQEIRNCLASTNLRETLQKMTESAIFKTATDNSIRSVRMENKEVALRFICFHHYYNTDKTLENYNGSMETTLDDATEFFSKKKVIELSKYITLFNNAMENAAYLFGNTYAFRKVLPKHLGPNAHKQLINKALFVSCSVLLSQFDPQELKQKVQQFALINPLADLIETDRKLYEYLSSGTNGKANIQYAFKVIENLINQFVKY